MAKITTFMYCEGVERLPDDAKISIMNPLQVLTPLFIPSMYSFAITVGVIDFDTEVNNEIRITFGSTCDEHNLVDTGIIPIQAHSAEGTLPKHLRGFIANMEFKNVVFKEEGEYDTTIYFNDEEIGKFPIYAVEGSE